MMMSRNAVLPPSFGSPPQQLRTMSHSNNISILPQVVVLCCVPLVLVITIVDYGRTYIRWTISSFKQQLLSLRIVMCARCFLQTAVCSALASCLSFSILLCDALIQRLAENRQHMTTKLLKIPITPTQSHLHVDTRHNERQEREDGTEDGGLPDLLPPISPPSVPARLSARSIAIHSTQYTISQQEKQTPLDNSMYPYTIAQQQASSAPISPHRSFSASSTSSSPVSRASSSPGTPRSPFHLQQRFNTRAHSAVTAATLRHARSLPQSLQPFTSVQQQIAGMRNQPSS